MLSAGSLRFVSRISILSSRPSKLTAMRTLRANGEAAVDLRIIENSPRQTRGTTYPQLTEDASNLVRRLPPRRSAGDHQVHGFGAFALLVRFDVEADLLSLVQTLKPSLFHGGDVDEHIAPSIVRFHKAIAAFAVEEFHNASLRHRENSSPRTAPPPAPRAAARPDIHIRGKHRPRMASVTPPSPLFRRRN